MGENELIVGMFNTLNTSLEGLAKAQRDTNEKLGQLKGGQEAQGREIRDLKGQVGSIVRHYSDCPAMEELKAQKESSDRIKVRVGVLEGKTPSKAPPPRSWMKEAFTAGNVRLVLIIILGLMALGGVSFSFLSLLGM